ncbi:hypothetical protein COU74_01460 [Candidatus Peregrinibacteria bacterium CG10_big_fil_rev_8_21_14_0_10_36_19]|nr:MAG: hypothetical protein COU74_01460 [Candidatus Peregrinibacteria bacterium CG10_big_fil_rev_8_21_14_0_10_36_19]
MLQTPAPEQAAPEKTPSQSLIVSRDFDSKFAQRGFRIEETGQMLEAKEPGTILNITARLKGNPIIKQLLLGDFRKNLLSYYKPSLLSAEEIEALKSQITAVTSATAAEIRESVR